MTSILKPNEEQKQCIDKITEFINLKKGFSRFLINGSAGTGKTSILISSILSYLDISIATRYEYFLEAVQNNKWELLDMIDNFIIAAPTNKAKDVLHQPKRKMRIISYSFFVNVIAPLQA